MEDRTYICLKNNFLSNRLYDFVQVAFNDMNLNKVFVYAFDLRPHLYPILKEKGFCFEARLINHARKKNEFVDVVIYSIFNSDEKN
jgi:RimJ/RimL family protein N-acetyltransferase